MKLRETTLSDFRGICEVQKRNNLSTTSYNEWKHLLTEHPFKDKLLEIPIGWVLENENGEIIGTNTNVPMMYEFNGKLLKVGNASSWAVDEKYRGYSIKLGMAWMKQSNVDLLLDTSAIEPVAKLLLARKFHPLPIKWYVQPLFWIINYPAFIGAVLKKKSINISSVFQYPIGYFVFLLDIIRKIFSNNRKNNYYDVLETKNFDIAFDELWMKLRKTNNRLLLLRDRKSLEWRHKSMFDKGKLCIIKAQHDGKLRGYAILWEFHRKHLGLRGFQIADLQALNDDPVCIKSLILGAIDAAKSRQLHIVEVAGFNRNKRDALEELKPFKLPSYMMPYYFKATDPALFKLLSNQDCWDPCLSDGF